MFKRHKHQWKYYSNDRSKDRKNMRECSCGLHQRLSIFDGEWSALRYEIPDTNGYDDHMGRKVFLLMVTLIIFACNTIILISVEWVVVSYFFVLVSLLYAMS